MCTWQVLERRERKAKGLSFPLNFCLASHLSTKPSLCLLTGKKQVLASSMPQTWSPSLQYYWALSVSPSTVQGILYKASQQSCDFYRLRNWGLGTENQFITGTKLVSGRVWVWTQVQATPVSLLYKAHSLNNTNIKWAGSSSLIAQRHLILNPKCPGSSGS